MMIKDKMILDGIWRVHSHYRAKNRTYYTLKNEYNGFEVTISDTTARKIYRGQTSVSVSIRRKFLRRK